MSAYAFRLPRFAAKLAAVADVWVVGSAQFNEDAKDIDLVVTPETWHLVAPSIPSSATPTTFGGWRFERDGRWFDVWPDRIERLAVAPQFTGGTHLRSGRRFK